MMVLQYDADPQTAIIAKVDGTQRGAVTRQGVDGCRAVCFDDTSITLSCDRVAAARSRGGVGLVSAVLAALRPDVRYSLFDQGRVIAQLRHVLRWGLGGHLALTLSDGTRWRVSASGLLPTRLRVECDGVPADEWQIEGVWRARLRMPSVVLPTVVALAFGAVALELWGNDPNCNSV